MSRSHIQGNHRGLAAAADGRFGRFGRMFSGLEGPEFDPSALAALAESMIKKDDGKFFNEGDSDENVFLPAGYTYFGQFVDHDLTLDTTAVGAQENDPEGVDNFRTAALDLDCVYGNGPGGDLVMYDGDYKLRLSSHRIGTPAASGPGSVRTQFDHRRDSSGIAMIGDPRNDENVIVAQVHQAMVMFHNKVLDTPQLMAEIPADNGHRSERFRRAARVVRWHYQWLIVNDYLKRICMPEIYRELVNPGGSPRTRYYPKPQDVAAYPYMPIEFAAAAYRFGHSMVRPSYALNATIGTDQGPGPTTRKPIFDGSAGLGGDLRGFKRILPDWGIDWGYFLELPGLPPGGGQLGAGTLQPAYRIDTLLVDPLRLLVNPDLLALPAIERNLAYLNLLRGSRLRLPTAEQIARAMNLGSFPAARFPLLTPEQIWSAGSRNAAAPKDDTGDEGLDAARSLRRPFVKRFAGNTPLWYYVLREAEWYGTRDIGDAPNAPAGERGSGDKLGGHHLGPIGSTIVLETFLGLLLADQSSYIHQAGWRPMSPVADDPDSFELKHLVQWALA